MVVTTPSASTSNSKSVTAMCPAGKFAVGGGGSVSTEGLTNVIVDQSEPGGLTGGKATTWVVRATEFDNDSDSWTVTAQVICATG